MRRGLNFGVIVRRGGLMVPGELAMVVVGEG